MGAQEPILRLKEVTKHFSGLQVLLGIDLEVLEGENHAVIGPNGAGKSTLFNIITGFHRVSSGAVIFRNEDISGLSPCQITRRGISRSFQINSNFPSMTVYENVRNAIISRFNRRFDWFRILHRDPGIQRETNRFIENFSMEDVKDTPASELSYGQQRQLEIALALALNPSLILLDEPTAGLNREETKSVVALIQKATVGKSLMIVEHDMEVVFNVADRITVMNNGHPLATGTPDEIRQNERVKEAYLGRQ